MICLNIIEDQLHLFYDVSAIFQQDNSSWYTTEVEYKWFQEDENLHHTPKI